MLLLASLPGGRVPIPWDDAVLLTKCVARESVDGFRQAGLQRKVVPRMLDVRTAGVLMSLVLA